MSVNGMSKDCWKIIDKQLKNVNLLCDILNDIPKNIESLTDGDDDRQNYLTDHGRESIENISLELEEINTQLYILSSLTENLNSLSENLENLKSYNK
ncbi:MAG: hypothetical protein NC177_06455 [Ruminococcus flavefaciens]|nr:hypothetical protein [Ruminococcus flavefaciens]